MVFLLAPVIRVTARMDWPSQRRCRIWARAWNGSLFILQLYKSGLACKVFFTLGVKRVLLFPIPCGMLFATMEVEFDDPDLDRLEVDPGFTAGFSPAIVRGFRKAMQAIRAAHDERDLHASRGFRFKKLKGKRSKERSMRLNQQWRLYLVIEDGGAGRRARIIRIGDDH